MASTYTESAKMEDTFQPRGHLQQKEGVMAKKKVNRLKKCVLICVIKGERKMYLLWTDGYSLCFTVLM